jgi:hypothetical protein
MVVTGLVPCAEKIVRKKLPGNVRLKSDSQARDLFILGVLSFPSLSFRAERGISDHFPGNARSSIQRCFAPLNMTTIGVREHPARHVYYYICQFAYETNGE